MNKSHENPLVSVVIPTYNRAHIIGRTIDSVIQQSYKNLEIIIVDDGSKDNTEEVINNIKDPRIRYIRNETNQGASITRNNGVAAANGEYVAFLDSDDVWLPKKVEWQLPSLQNHPHPDKVVGYTQVTNDLGTEVSIMPIRAKKEDEPLGDYLFVNGGLMQTGTLMMPRKLALENPFRPGIVPHEDPELCLRLEAKGAFFTFTEHPLTTWNNDRRQHRATNTSDYLIPLNLSQEYESLISPRAVKGFLVIKVVGVLIEREDKRLFAEKLLIDALLHGAISMNQFLVLTRRVIIPKKIRFFLANYFGF